MKTYFNPTVLKKDITRFAPLWGLYTVFMLLFLLLIRASYESPAQLANQVGSTMAFMGMVNIVYGGLCAIVLFGDLFTARMCNMLHALPLRREGWFFTHLVSGLLFCLVPNVLGSLIAAALLQSYGYMAFMWLGLTLMQYLFFFGLGSFSALCAGTKLGAVAVYTLVNFLSVLAAWLIQSFYEPLLYGITINLNAISRLSPVVMFTDDHFIETHYDNMKDMTVVEGIPSEPWIYAGVAAGVGVALLALALLIYRKRAMESAGDLISLKPVAPVLLVLYTLCVGAVLYFFAGDLSQRIGYLFLLVGLAIGFFTGRMLLEKRVAVFRGMNFLNFGILLAVFGLSLGVARLDPFGITRYIPKASQVESIMLSPYSSVYSLDRQSCLVTDPEDIAVLQKLHADAIQNPSSGNESTTPVHLRYQLKSGAVVDRTYQLPDPLGYTPLVQGFYSRPVCVLGTDKLNVLMEHMDQLEFYPYEDRTLPYIYIGRTQEYDLAEKYGDAALTLAEVESGSFASNATVKAIMEAVYADCQEGNMSQWWNSANALGMLHLQVNYGQYREYLDITVYESSRNTLSLLETLASNR